MVSYVKSPPDFFNMEETKKRFDNHGSNPFLTNLVYFLDSIFILEENCNNLDKVQDQGEDTDKYISLSTSSPMKNSLNHLLILVFMVFSKGCCDFSNIKQRLRYLCITKYQ